MGLGEIIGILILAIIINLALWSRGFYSRKSSRGFKDLKGFTVDGKHYKFSREDLSDEEKMKEMTKEAMNVIIETEK